MTELPEPVASYIRAYNAIDVAGMLACLSDDVMFQNISDGEVTAEATSKDAFEAMSKMGAEAFSAREQKVIGAITVADTTLVEIAYTAVVAADLPNGWKAGQELAFTGASLFVHRDGKICRLVDQS